MWWYPKEFIYKHEVPSIIYSLLFFCTDFRFCKRYAANAIFG